MSPSPRVSLGVRATQHGPEHRFQCDECQGKGKVTVEGRLSAYIEDCLECHGGELTDPGCDCSICQSVRNSLEMLRGVDYPWA